MSLSATSQQLSSVPYASSRQSGGSTGYGSLRIMVSAPPSVTKPDLEFVHTGVSSSRSWAQKTSVASPSMGAGRGTSIDMQQVPVARRVSATSNDSHQFLQSLSFISGRGPIMAGPSCLASSSCLSNKNSAQVPVRHRRDPQPPTPRDPQPPPQPRDELCRTSPLIAPRSIDAVRVASQSPSRHARSISPDAKGPLMSRMLPSASILPHTHAQQLSHLTQTNSCYSIGCSATQPYSVWSPQQTAESRRMVSSEQDANQDIAGRIHRYSSMQSVLDVTPRRLQVAPPRQCYTHRDSNGALRFVTPNATTEQVRADVQEDTRVQNQVSPRLVQDAFPTPPRARLYSGQSGQSGQDIQRTERSPRARLYSGQSGQDRSPAVVGRSPVVVGRSPAVVGRSTPLRTNLSSYAMRRVANASSTGVFIAEPSSGHQVPLFPSAEVPPAQKAEDKQIKNSQNFTQEQWKAFEDVEQMELLDEIRRLERVVEEERERNSEERDRSNALQEKLAAEINIQKSLHSRDVKDLEESVTRAIRENERLSGLVDKLLTCVASNGKTIAEVCPVSGDTGSGLCTPDESPDISGDTGDLLSSTFKAELHRRRRPDDKALLLSTPDESSVIPKKLGVLKASPERQSIARMALSSGRSIPGLLGCSIPGLVPRFKSASNQKEPECDTTDLCTEESGDPNGREENMEDVVLSPDAGRKSWGSMGSRRESDDEWDCVSTPR